MPYVNVKLTRGPLTTEEKAEIIAGMTEVLHRVVNKDPEAVIVVIEEIDSESWGKGGESLAVRRARQKA